MVSFEKHGAGRLVHHRAGDVQRCDQRIERRRGAVHHECFLDGRPFHLSALAVADVDVGRHRECGQHLVGRLHAEHGRPVLHVVRNAHRITVLVDRMELAVGVPGLVEVQPRHAVGEQFRHLVDVVEDAVVGGIGDDGMHRFRGLRASGQRRILDQALDVFLGEALGRNQPDHSVAVAAWLEVHRPRTRQRHRMVQ